VTGVIGDRTLRTLASQLGSLAARVDTLETGARGTQLGDSSIENGYISIYDDAAILRARVGRQPDGSFVGGVSQNNPIPPPVPKPPTVITVLAGVRVTGNGPLSGRWPADFLHYNVYAQDEASPTPAVVGTLANDADVMILSLPAGSTWDVWLTSVNLSGTESIASDIVQGSPSQVVSAEILDGAISELKIAADAVTAAKIAAGAVTVTKIADDSITTPKIVAGAVQAVSIAADAVTAGKIAANAITAREIVALSITANELAANSVTATQITAGAVTAAKLEADLVLATRVIAGNPAGARTEMHPTSGLQAYLADNTTRTFWINAATGAAFLMGEITTATTGARIQINPGGAAPDTIRFYDATSNYAEITAIPAPASTAAVLMRGTRSSATNVRGNVAAYATEGFVALQSETSGGVITQNGALSCIDGSTNLWGGEVTVEGRRAKGTGNVIFRVKDSGGTVLTDVYIYATGSNQPAMRRTTTDQVLTWSTADMYSGDSAGNPRAFAGAAYVTVSGSASKKNIKPRHRVGPDNTFRDLVSRVVPKEYNYATERAPGDPAPPPRTITRREARRNAAGRAQVDASGVPLFDVTEETAPDPPETKPHYFFVAEEVAAVAPELVREDPTKPGGYTISLADICGALWKASAEQEAELRQLRTDRNNGPMIPVGPPNPAGSGGFSENNGTLFYTNSFGQTRKVA
jgi:hypothetical protein